MLGTRGRIIRLLLLDRGRLSSFWTGNFIFYICLFIYLDWVKLLGPRHVSLGKTWTSSGHRTSNHSRRLCHICATFREVVGSLYIDVWTVKRLRVGFHASHSATQLVLLFLSVHLLLSLFSCDFRQVYDGLLFASFWIIFVTFDKCEWCLIETGLIVEAS